jgi:hypothetical protein
MNANEKWRQAPQDPAFLKWGRPDFFLGKKYGRRMACSVEREGRGHSGEVEAVMEFDLERAFE